MFWKKFGGESSQNGNDDNAKEKVVLASKIVVVKSLVSVSKVS